MRILSDQSNIKAKGSIPVHSSRVQPIVEEKVMCGTLKQLATSKSRELVIHSGLGSLSSSL